MTTTTTEEALRFLRSHQPLPDDAELSPELLATYDEVRRHFLENPDPRSVPLLLNSFGKGSGFGVYQLVVDTLKAHARDNVVTALVDSLRNPHEGVRSWSMEIASDFPDERLIPAILAGLQSGNEDIRYFAAGYLADNNRVADTDAIREALRKESDEEIADLLRSALGSPKVDLDR